MNVRVVNSAVYALTQLQEKMKVMIDTNIFISAALYPTGKAAQALRLALMPPPQTVTCDYVVDELMRKCNDLETVF